MGGWDGLGAYGHDQRAWSDVAADRNQDKVDDYKPNGAWSGPSHWGAGTNDAPGHTRMFHDDEEPDDPSRMFTERRTWWGKKERFDSRGRKIS